MPVVHCWFLSLSLCTFSFFLWPFETSNANPLALVVAIAVRPSLRDPTVEAVAVEAVLEESEAVLLHEQLSLLALAFRLILGGNERVSGVALLAVTGPALFRLEDAALRFLREGCVVRPRVERGLVREKSFMVTGGARKEIGPFM
eukprot:CCRYP_002044-RA/>CCRYP_002044-RA protein AED:0.45 eAED:0.88 QI:0/0/0.5/1/0/0/2/81/144